MALTLSPASTYAQNADPAKMLEACRAIADSAARLRCFENATSNLAPKQQPPGSGTSMEAWRLVRTPNPAGGAEVVSIMHTADLLRSDPDLAGLIIRCAEQGQEVLLALITPLPPRARPQVVLGDPNRGTRMEAKVIPPGASILLPGDAATLSSGPWQALGELAVEVRDEGTTVRGIIPLRGLDAALQTLRANCPAR
jgi:hypothetical protein